MVSVLANAPGGVREAHCLIDSGAERNFISQSWVKEHELPEDHATLEQIQAVDGRRIPCYGTHQIGIELTDHEEVRKSWNTDVNAAAAGFFHRTALQAAAERGHLEVMESLLAADADVNAAAADHGGRTAL